MSLIDKKVQGILQQIDFSQSPHHAAQRALSMMDLSYYEGRDTATIVKRLCSKAITPYGSVAAVCVMPQFVKLARSLVKDDTVQIISSVDTLMKRSPSQIVSDIEFAIKEGADAVEIIFPYALFLSGKRKKVEQFMQDCSIASGHKALLKMTLQVTMFPDLESIYDASRLVIDVGADFIKTSSGRKASGVTLPIATTILLAIQESSQTVGFKAAVGINALHQAAEYLTLTDFIMGEEGVSPETFRFGADEKLLADLMEYFGQ